MKLCYYSLYIIKINLIKKNQISVYDDISSSSEEEDKIDSSSSEVIFSKISGIGSKKFSLTK